MENQKNFLEMYIIWSPAIVSNFSFLVAGIICRTDNLQNTYHLSALLAAFENFELASCFVFADLICPCVRLKKRLQDTISVFLAGIITQIFLFTYKHVSLYSEKNIDEVTC